MTGRPIVIVDLETTALRPSPRDWRSGKRREHEPDRGLPYGIVVEVGWWNVSTGEHASFVPPHDVDTVLAHGDPDALRINRYRERLAGAPQADPGEWGRLYEQLVDVTLAGSNPAFDAERWLAGSVWADLPVPQPWHSRLLDVAAYVAGYLRRPGNALEGLSGCCDLLGVDRPDHTVAGDVRAAGECLLAVGAVPDAAEGITPR